MVLTDWAGPRRVDDRWREEFMLLDRQTERAAIDRVLDAVRSGFSGTLVLRGGPGGFRHRRCRVGDQHGVRWPAPAAGPVPAAAERLAASAAGRAAGRFRPGSRAAAGELPGGTGDAHAAFPGG